MTFSPKYDFIVGIDSDGTVFDSMTIKHNLAFLPAFFETWNVEDYRKIVEANWEFVNLTSRDRGCNRFIGLLKAFENLEKNGAKPYDYSDLTAFVQNSKALSNKGLLEYIGADTEGFLGSVYKWSLRCDELFEVHNEGQPPFKNVLEALKLMSAKADIAVISSASYGSIAKDWTDNGLMAYVSIACGQESGSKIKQLKDTAGGYKKNHVLMMGDAPGDQEAAVANGALFFPVIPKRETECWELLINEAFEKFMNGSYAGDYEKKLVEEFERALGV